MTQFLNGLLAPVEVIAIERIGRGQSNPTYRLDCKDRTLALRAKPPGVLLRSAHQVEREFRVMTALRDTGIPVPEMIALVSDQDSPLGRAFYIMGFVEGEVHFNPTLPDLNLRARARIYDEMNRVLAELHQVNVDSVGLADFGKPGNYFMRQTDRWKRQYLQSRIEPNRDMDRLVGWLEENMVEDDGEVALVHGDFRLDNLVFERGSHRLLAVLDWELSTLGHPLADLAYQCMQWKMPFGGALRGLGEISRSEFGLPSDAQYRQDYCRRRQIPLPGNWKFYLLFAFFRLAAILEGVGRRALDGNAANPEMAMEYGKQVPILASKAGEILDGAP